MRGLFLTDERIGSMPNAINSNIYLPSSSATLAFAALYSGVIPN